MGAGPKRLIARGAMQRLEAHGAVNLINIDPDLTFPTEIGTAFELHRAGASAVAESLAASVRPIVLPGNCNSSIGTVAGIKSIYPQERLGIIWFDGHGDCNTPETFSDDFLDAMALSTLTGRCWQAFVRTVLGFEATDDSNVVLIGAHGADAGAKGILAASGITVVSPAPDMLQHLETALTRLERQGITRVYLHLDIDVLDAGVATANQFAPMGGLSPDILAKSLTLISSRFAVLAFCVASFDPSLDDGGIVSGIALDAIETAGKAACEDTGLRVL